MSPWLRASALAVASLVAGALAAQAADLNYRDYGPPRHGSAYDDPRYADLYGDQPTAPPQPERRYAQPQPYSGYGHAPIRASRSIAIMSRATTIARSIRKRRATAPIPLAPRVSIASRSARAWSATAGTISATHRWLTRAPPC